MEPAISQPVEMESYFPPSESDVGWRWIASDEEAREVAGFDAPSLDVHFRLHDLVYGGSAWSVVIVRHGWLVREYSTFNVASSTRFDLWSSTKSFTAAAWGHLLGGHSGGVTMDTPAYELIPEGRPLSDPRKSDITVRHLLSMTSGIPGEESGVYGMANATTNGVYEFALGHAPNRYGQWAAELVAEPGTRWEYSDAAYAHLSLAFAAVTGQEIAEYFSERVLNPIGVRNVAWDLQGGSGFLGPHTNPHTGLHLSARDFARFGYLALHDGVWAGERLLPEGWVRMATTPSQDENPSYGYGWWTNAAGSYQPGLTKDLFAFSGFAGNRCFVIPSLDLVVARVGTGPALLHDKTLLDGIVRALV